VPTFFAHRFVGPKQVARVAKGLKLEESLGVQPLALGVTKDGHPRHPLYVPYSAEKVPFKT